MNIFVLHVIDNKYKLIKWNGSKTVTKVGKAIYKRRVYLGIILLEGSSPEVQVAGTESESSRL